MRCVRVACDNATRVLTEICQMRGVVRGTFAFVSERRGGHERADRWHGAHENAKARRHEHMSTRGQQHTITRAHKDSDSTRAQQHTSTQAQTDKDLDGSCVSGVARVQKKRTHCHWGVMLVCFEYIKWSAHMQRSVF